MDTIKSAEEKITILTDHFSKEGKNIPTTIAEIPNIPFQTFQEIQQALISHKILIQHFAFRYSPEYFDILANPFEKMLLTVYSKLALAITIIFAVLSFVYSWWCLLGILIYPVGMSKFKKMYNSIIYKSSFQSEIIFCFLYYVGQICLTTPNYSTDYHWN
jgi:hypothetical protein